MILDLENPDTPDRFDADVCILGTGAAGITLARRLAGTGLDVVILEAGGMMFERESHEVYDGTSTGMNYAIDLSRLRYFGGSTNHWSGWCGPLDAEDFEPRPWVPTPGWPISKGELDPYYRDACAFLELGPYVFDRRVAEPPAPSYTPRGAAFFETFQRRQCPNLRLGYVHRGAIEATDNVRVVIHANALPIEADGRVVREVRMSTMAGRMASVRAGAFVVACGGMENTRLLLASRNLANSSGLVGLGFMDHVFSMFAGLVIPIAEFEERERFRSRLGLPPLVSLKISFEAQREMGLLSCSVGADPNAVPERQKNQGPPGAGTMYPIFVVGEQPALSHSRIGLDPAKKDRFGVPRIVVHRQVDDLTQRTIREAVLRYGAMLTRMGIGRVFIPTTRTELEWPFWVWPAFHPSGTTRMSDDPKAGVVNRDGRTHDVENLYLAGSSVFPAIGHINPTMTIVALAFRLADHLRDSIGKR
ncbi:MAG: GMC family oxidoreductase [Phycisphaeraceae bacterium]|nr:GMC family oxidoreductase [Phycisphaerae bacterium]MBX3393067.1 GMC family oxidoreductase [Phycisphaeraceae bacterium]HRJ50488.1 GMC family oxidoreductase [Phycisphaerales bacterium]